MSTKLKLISANSWLVISDNEERLGLLTSANEKYTLMVKNVKKRFSSREEINQFFKEDVFDQVITTPIVTAEKTCYINGFPASCSTPHDVLIAGVSLPLYSKTKTSGVVFSAGYYCLDFPKMWQPAFSPKYTTLQSYNYKGPYITEEEMHMHLVKLRRLRGAKGTQI